jgi:hypothetical protein
MEDFAGIMRRLWKGETIIGHDGPAGRWPVLRLDPTFDEDIRLTLTAFGPETLRSPVGASTTWCCTRSSPTRPPSAPCAR